VSGPEGIQNLKQYLQQGFFPVLVPSELFILSSSKRKLSVNLLPEIIEERKTLSLRKLAKKYNVSHQTIRMALKASKKDI